MQRKILRVRRRIAWSPVWGREYQGWAAKFIGANKWRCDPLLGFDDLMQEAWLVFDHVAHTYPRVIHPQQFMALYKQAMVNKFHDNSMYKKRKGGLAGARVFTSRDVSELYTGRIGEATNAGYLKVLLDEAPEELKLVMGYLTREARPVKVRRRRLQPRENLNAKVRRILGLPNNYQPVLELKRLLAK